MTWIREDHLLHPETKTNTHAAPSIQRHRLAALVGGDCSGGCDLSAQAPLPWGEVTWSSARDIDAPSLHGQCRKSPPSASCVHWSDRPKHVGVCRQSDSRVPWSPSRRAVKTTTNAMGLRVTGARGYISLERVGRPHQGVQTRLVCGPRSLRSTNRSGIGGPSQKPFVFSGDHPRKRRFLAVALQVPWPFCVRHNGGLRQLRPRTIRPQEPRLREVSDCPGATCGARSHMWYNRNAFCSCKEQFR